MRRTALVGLILALALPAKADDLGLDPPSMQQAKNAQDPPWGWIHSTDVRSLVEDPLLRPEKKPALYALGESFHSEREPVILVHGLNGDFGDLQPLVDRYSKDERFQLYLLAYADKARRTSQSGDAFAEELRAFGKALGKRDVTILAHSMGGLVTRRALNELTAGPAKGLELFGRIRFVAIDSPWSGFAGPSDRGFAGFTMKMVAVFMPDGLEDMRGKSNMFRGDPKSHDEASRAGLFGVTLPRQVETTLVFAQSGDQALDYTEKPVSPLASKLVGLYARGEKVEGDQRIENFWSALQGARTFHAFENEVRERAAAGTLCEETVLSALERFFPRFPGDHSSVIGAESFLAYLDSVLLR